MRRVGWPVLVVLGAVQVAWGGGVHVAVATNFSRPFARIAAAFTAASGHEVTTSAAATGKLAAQIAAGAPFEVLLAADEETPTALVTRGLALADGRVTYAVGQLVLWSARADVVDDAGAVLGTDRFRHLAIANPKLAPYGAAAMQVLAARGLEVAVRPRLVTAESVAQAQQFVASGNAELGFVALSQVIEPGGTTPGSYWLVPRELYGAIRQDAVVLRVGRENPAARALLVFLGTEAARSVIAAYGYALP